MPRIPRSDANSRFFHTMVQGIEKSFIFDNAANMNFYLNLLNKNSKKFNVSILAYCVMNNHAHILIYVHCINDMIKFFRCVNTAYAKHFNSQNQRVGYVFRNRYKSEAIYTVRQLFNTINYIHNNPVKAKICSEAQDYEYSSYNEYFKKSKIINKEMLKSILNQISFLT